MSGIFYALVKQVAFTVLLRASTVELFTLLLLCEQIFLVGAIAKLGATVSTYPLLVVKVKSFIYLWCDCEIIFES